MILKALDTRPKFICDIDQSLNYIKVWLLNMTLKSDRVEVLTEQNQIDDA